jgi:hypothetical protein
MVSKTILPAFYKISAFFVSEVILKTFRKSCIRIRKKCCGSASLVHAWKEEVWSECDSIIMKWGFSILEVVLCWVQVGYRLFQDSSGPTHRCYRRLGRQNKARRRNIVNDTSHLAFKSLFLLILIILGYSWKPVRLIFLLFNSVPNPDPLGYLIFGRPDPL